MLGFRRPSPAMVVAVIALIAALSGTAFAALGKNSVGSRQLKKKSVTTGKIANNAVNGAKVANGSLSGADINLAALGKVPSAAAADQAGNAETLSGHAAACPPAATLIRGTCFDSAPGPVLANLKAAADACAAKGGFLPSPMELYSVRGVINLGTGVGTDKTFTDSYYYDASTGSAPSTVLIDGTGAVTQQAVTSAGRYVCAYPLVR
jgi:hypothetical protein